MELAEKCYLATRDFPKQELFGLVSQIRRAAGSIPANIAEGQGRAHTKQFLNHLSIARGSLMELETHLILSARLKLIDRKQLIPVWRQTQQVGRMLTSLIRSLQEQSPPK